MPNDIPALAAAFLATWQPDASPLLRAALIDLLTSVRGAERERCAEIADRRAFEWRDILGQEPESAIASNRWHEACDIGVLIRAPTATPRRGSSPLGCRRT